MPKLKTCTTCGQPIRPPHPPRLYISVGEASKRLHLSISTVLRACNEKIIHSFKTPGGHHRVSAEVIDKLLKAREGA